MQGLIGFPGVGVQGPKVSNMTNGIFFYFYCSCKQPELNTLLLLQGEKGLQGPKGNPGPAGLGQKGDKVMLTVTVTAITNM